MLFIWVAIALTTHSHTHVWETHWARCYHFIYVDRCPNPHTVQAISAFLPRVYVHAFQSHSQLELGSHLIARLYDSGWMHVWSRGLGLLQMPLLFLAVDFSAVAEFCTEPKLYEGEQNIDYQGWICNRVVKTAHCHKILILAEGNSQNVPLHSSSKSHHSEENLNLTND